MGFFDRIGNGMGRVNEAVRVGWEHGPVGAVVCGAAALTGEAVMQPISTGLSLIGKGDAADRHYDREMFKPTKKEVEKAGSHTGTALLMLSGGVVSGLLHTPGAVVDVVHGREPKVAGRKSSKRR